MTHVLRPATAAEAPRLAAIHMTARARAMPWLPVLHDADETTGWMRDVVIPAMTVLVANVADAPVGYMALDADSLDQLYVGPAHQGHGIGTVLLAEAMRLRPLGFVLWVFARNARARAFYQRHGLVAVAATDGAANEEREPDVQYAWQPTLRAP